MISSLIAMTPIFGNNQDIATKKKSQPTPIIPMKPGEELQPGQYATGYSTPAQIAINRDWDFYGTGTFTYWQATQDGTVAAAIMSTNVQPRIIQILDISCSYHPGFKLSFGINIPYDHWASSIDYTWFRGTNSSNASVNADGSEEILYVGGIEAPLIEHALNYFQKWHLGMDLVDWTLGRKYYSGTSLLFHPSFGIRAAWIRQKSLLNGLDIEDGELNFDVKWNCWGVGPRVGIQSDWLIGKGIRFFGMGAGDILYTHYSSLNTTGNVSVINRPAFGTVRAHLELEFGLGWGTYLAEDTWHIDLSAGYGFQAFFDQNMYPFDQFFDPNNNLYMQGLNLNARLDF